MQIFLRFTSASLNIPRERRNVRFPRFTEFDRSTSLPETFSRCKVRTGTCSFGIVSHVSSYARIVSNKLRLNCRSLPWKTERLHTISVEEIAVAVSNFSNNTFGPFDSGRRQAFPREKKVFSSFHRRKATRLSRSDTLPIKNESR